LLKETRQQLDNYDIVTSLIIAARSEIKRIKIKYTSIQVMSNHARFILTQFNFKFSALPT